MFSSPGLSLALQMNKNDELSRMIGDLDSVVRTHKEELENDISKSVSEHLDGVSGDDLEQDNPRKRKKRYHRHTPHQIQELETLFKECPHPDEKQRNELSKCLSLDPRQVKFWFQNRRTQMKTQLERHENSLLRQENERLKYEHMTIRDAIRNPTCNNCGGCAILGELSFEQQQLRIENARLKDELDRVCSLAGKFLGQSATTLSASSLLNSSLELAARPNGFCCSDYFNNNNMSSSMGTTLTPPYKAVSNFGSVDDAIEKSVLLELASSAINELVKMAQLHEPLWVRNFDGGEEILNSEEYLLAFPRCIGSKPIDYISEATRATGMVILSSFTLVETLMDATRWANMFPSMIARATTTDIISRGVGGTRNGALQLMQAELQVLSPLVPTRDINFLRFCNQIAEGVWAVVDVSCDAIRENLSGNSKCRRLPSGCLVQDMPNGYSQVTWVEHTEYDETAVRQLYRSVLRSGIALGAHRWVSTLKSRCECLAILMSTSFPITDTTVTPTGRKSMLKLSQRMMDNFCSGICPSSARKWTQLTAGNIGKDVRVMTRQNLEDPGEPPGVVISAAMSVWLPVLPGRLFDFLKNASLRSEWDILSNGEPMLEMTHIAKGQDEGNAVSLLRTSAANGNQGNNMLILQETCTDASNSMVVYAPVDIPAMHIVMNGGDSTCVALLPSGFSILPDSAGGSLLTIGFQILVNTLPSAKLTMESVETVSNLISCTIQKIKAALHVEG